MVKPVDGEKRYEGRACRVCGCTTRYVNGETCIRQQRHTPEQKAAARTRPRPKRAIKPRGMRPSNTRYFQPALLRNPRSDDAIRADLREQVAGMIDRWNALLASDRHR